MHRAFFSANLAGPSCEADVTIPAFAGGNLCSKKVRIAAHFFPTFAP
jgi:hypothetical protein